MPRLVSLLFHDVFDSDPSESGFSGPRADRYKLTRPAFTSLLDALASGGPDVRLVRSAADLPTENALTLTVDDGGSSFSSPVADMVERRGWRAHCFMTTGSIGARGFLTAAALRDLDARGHVIGSHSVNHPSRFGTRPWHELIDEWHRSRATLEDVLGHDVRVASLPGGALSRLAARAAAAAGLSVLFTSEPVARPWTVDGCLLLGRFTVLPATSPGTVAALAAGDLGPLAHQWIGWSVKKVFKPVLGGAYPRVSEWVLARRG